MLSLRSLIVALIALALLAAPMVYLVTRPAPAPHHAALAVTRAYLRATYARDFAAAYRFISSADRQARNKSSFVSSQAGYSGFTAQLARQLAEYGEISLVRMEQTEPPRIEVAYSFPAPEDLAALVLNWDEEKLNALSLLERRQISDELTRRQRTGKLILMQGRESFDLVKEGSRWKLFFDWSNGLKVTFKTASPEASIELRLAQQEIILTSDDPFQVNLTISNHGTQAKRFTVIHQVEPAAIAGQMEMIECGLSRPVTLPPGSEREFTMAYLLSQQARHSTKAIVVTYLLQP